MDKAQLIESQFYSPMWATKGLEEYGTIVNYLNSVGTDDPKRQPLRNFMIPMCGLSRAPMSQRRLNVRENRYHLPGGLEYRLRDLYGMYNSSPKPIKPGYIDQPIRVNPGIWGEQLR